MTHRPLSILPLAALLALLSFCGCRRHTKAETLYRRAEQAFGEGAYSAAQRLIDSIPEVDATAFTWIRRGTMLNQRIILEYNRRNLAYLDSILPEVQREERKMASEFVPIFDPESLSDTLYYHCADRYAGRTDTCCLRMEFTVDGRARVSSVYCGKKPLRHISAKAELPDGSYALTPTVPYDDARNYRFMRPDGRYSEVVCYTGHSLRPFVEIIATTGEKPIKISYAGEHPYSYYLSKENRRSFEKCYRYLYLKHRVRSLEQNKELAERTIELLSRQLAEENDW